MEKLSFFKYHGLGNDFIIVDGVTNDLPNDIINLHPEIIKKLCNRNLGIGSDGLIIVLPSSFYDYQMKYYNSDGTQGEMCGNGIRCLIKYISDFGINNGKLSFEVETLAGKISAELIGNDIKVNMGKPIFNPQLIPTLLESGDNNIPQGILNLKEISFHTYAVGMGNPHALIIVEQLENIDLDSYGNYIENNALFPLKTNVHFAKIHSRKLIELLVWERGCGPTKACGTGACAALAVLHSLDKCDSEAIIKLPGGNLVISWPNTLDDIYMTGPAQYVYSGNYANY